VGLTIKPDQLSPNPLIEVDRKGCILGKGGHGVVYKATMKG
jgi:hypothetical protein